MSSRSAYRTAFGFATVLLFGAAIHCFGQTEQKDQADAIRVGRQAGRFLQQTQDIRPLIRKYAVKDFLNGVVDDHLFNVFAALDEDLLPQLDPKTRDAYYIAVSNLLYLVIIYNCANNPGLKNAYGGEKLVFPPGVEKLMRGKPILSTWLDDSKE